jgi:hypothetical protein
MVVVVSVLMYHFKIEPPPHRKQEFEAQPGETPRQRLDRLLNGKVAPALQGREIELAFRRRR